MVHGHRDGIPGMDECLAISRIGSGLEVSANTTALLFNAPTRAGGPDALAGDNDDRLRMSDSDEQWWSEHLGEVARVRSC